jgi:O-acetyl-ADP-ribose deacetylase (regulator of RNase III)
MNFFKGSVLDSPVSQPILHCVSADFAMGKGVAAQIAHEYDCDRTALRTALKNQSGGKIGTCIVDQRSKRRTIIHLVTKTTYWSKPTLESLRAALESSKTALDLINQTTDAADEDDDSEFAKNSSCEAKQPRRITHLAMPKIGCGLDRLSWDHQVLPMIEDVFAASQFVLNVYSF